MKKAVLLIFWNRPDYTEKVFSEIKRARPPRIYLSSDGPRNPNEASIVRELREWVLNHIDWPCEVKTRFLDENSGGCANGVSRAVTWFFENEPDGIILEDDIVPHQDFFPYCEELLDRYKDDKRIWHITGHGTYKNTATNDSYYFAQLMHCWGWASWADRWRHFTLDLSNYDETKLSRAVTRPDVVAFWKTKLHKLRAKEIDSWAYPWTLWIIAYGGLCINPYKNLISNIGYSGVHYSGKDPFLCRRTFPILPLIHPEKIEFNERAIDYIYTDSCAIGLSLFQRILRRLACYLKP